MYGQMPYPYGNPTIQSAQQRLQMMEAQYPQFAANYGQPMGQPPYSSVSDSCCTGTQG